MTSTELELLEPSEPQPNTEFKFRPISLDSHGAVDIEYSINAPIKQLREGSTLRKLLGPAYISIGRDPLPISYYGSEISAPQRDELPRQTDTLKTPPRLISGGFHLASAEHLQYEHLEYGLALFPVINDQAQYILNLMKIASPRARQDLAAKIHSIHAYAHIRSDGGTCRVRATDFITFAPNQRFKVHRIPETMPSYIRESFNRFPLYTSEGNKNNLPFSESVLVDRTPIPTSAKYRLPSVRPFNEQQEEVLVQLMHGSDISIIAGFKFMMQTYEEMNLALQERMLDGRISDQSFHEVIQPFYSLIVT